MSAKRAVILGPGLIGGSLGLALKQTKAFASVCLWGRNGAFIPDAKRAGLEASTDLESTLKGADVVVFCVPVAVLPELAKRAAKGIPEKAILTDAGSTKGWVVREMEQIFGKRFVGSHPMAGSEQSGFSAASKTLFHHASCILTPTQTTSQEAIDTISRLWTDVGGRVHQMTPEAHDHLVARISHVPHIAASALVHLAECAGEKAQELSGGGYRDTTRVASGSADLWTEILEGNREEVAHALDTFIDLLTKARLALSESNSASLHEFLLQAKAQRDRLSSRHHV